MNIFNLKEEELKMQAKEFNQTTIGAKAKLFSILPGFVGIIICVQLVAIAFLDGVTNRDMYIYSLIVLSAMTLCIAIMCITQMQYTTMLKEYVESKKTTKSAK